MKDSSPHCAKLAGLGYRRSAKKCKEKFENVDKYYRRTKDARAGRQDGRSYRFFAQLEALHAAAHQQRQATGMAAAVRGDHQPSAPVAWTAAPAAVAGPPAGAALPDLSMSSMSGSDSDSESESESDDDLDAGVAGPGKGESGGGDGEMMAIFEGMMRQVTEKQDAMQRVFLGTLERWEAERTAREEAWRRQEVARMNREREQLARERAAAASRDAALIAFLQRVGGGPQQGEPVPLPPPIAAAQPVPDRAPPSPRHDAAGQVTTSLQPVPAAAPPKPEEARPWAGGEGSGGSTPSRWPKEEVQALIQLRTDKDEQDHDAAGAKGPLWEDIAAAMRRIGYNRSAKRCKEKWENINKYYKKVKESNKRRPEDSKTCPYFHQLDAMHRKKRFAGGGSSTAPGTFAAAGAGAGTMQESPNLRELEGKSSNDDADRLRNGGQGNVNAPPCPGNGETAPTTTENKRAEDTVKGTNVQLLQRQFGANETESDDNDMGGDYTVERNDEDKMKYTTAFQKPNVIGSSGNNAPAPAPPATAAAPTSSAAPASSTFLAVQ
ncbi:trihelix transcription factor GTL1-like isoform X3 [Panicum virgatum]|uniref:trihelix transcription factor GTL1-like isoform X3 n=1 Tax=Panicum virgatum TaxID=38727 RepID=UPI0019D68B50|nr:trihelix transcription factor GTL1-like isoform X3 [Panicum virgatum]